MSSSSTTYVIPTCAQKRREFPRERGSVSRTATSEVISLYERPQLIDFITRLQDVEEEWVNDPPLLQPTATRHLRVEYHLGGRLEFPPLSEEDSNALNETN